MSDNAPAEPVELTLVTATFHAQPGREGALAAVLAKYVVLSRQQGGCRNIDLATSALTPGRFVIVEKWETPAAQQAHFDSAEMVEMAQAASPLLSHPPDLDLLEPVSAHDLI
jgi:quinol monooxygenase YgiN